MKHVIITHSTHPRNRNGLSIIATELTKQICSIKPCRFVEASANKIVMIHLNKCVLPNAKVKVQVQHIPEL